MAAWPVAATVLAGLIRSRIAFIFSCLLVPEGLSGYHFSGRVSISSQPNQVMKI